LNQIIIMIVMTVLGSTPNVRDPAELVSGLLRIDVKSILETREPSRQIGRKRHFEDLQVRIFIEGVDEFSLQVGEKSVKAITIRKGSSVSLHSYGLAVLEPLLPGLREYFPGIVDLFNSLVTEHPRNLWLGTKEIKPEFMDVVLQGNTVVFKVDSETGPGLEVAMSFSPRTEGLAHLPISSHLTALNSLTNGVSHSAEATLQEDGEP